MQKNIKTLVHVNQNILKIRYSLIFFYISLCSLSGCHEATNNLDIQMERKGGMVVSIRFAYPENSKDIAVYVQGEKETALLGSFDGVGEQQRFTPVVPFTSGQAYEIRKGGEVLSKFIIPSSISEKQPEIIEIYPVQDTVPQNLLKIYVQFSRPMQNVGSALDYITVYNDTEKKEEQVFLPLETELWNREHDRLTLWLDPGSIKTDLLPNRKEGLPLATGNDYTLVFSDTWKTASGQSLHGGYSKKWHVTERDETKPDVENWTITPPSSGSTFALSIKFEEPLDYILARESLKILNDRGETLSGKWEVTSSAKSVRFTPTKSWSAGNYDILVDAKLEDWAGNNLNRLFDENLLNQPKQIEYNETFLKSFRIE